MGGGSMLQAPALKENQPSRAGRGMGLAPIANAAPKATEKKKDLADLGFDSEDMGEEEDEEEEEGEAFNVSPREGTAA